MFTITPTYPNAVIDSLKNNMAIKITIVLLKEVIAKNVLALIILCSATPENANITAEKQLETKTYE